MCHYILLRKTSPESTQSKREQSAENWCCWFLVLILGCFISHRYTNHSKDILIITVHWCYLQCLRIPPFPSTSAAACSNTDPCTGRWVTGVRTDTVPYLISPETLVHIPGGWWGYSNPDPRRQKTSQFGDYEEHNTQHSGFRISAQHSSLHCRHAEHTRGKDERAVSSRSSDFNLECLPCLMADTVNLEGEGFV